MRIRANHILTKLFAVFVFVYCGTTSPVFGQSPVANFTGSPLAGCSPMIINFTDLSTGNPTSWNWDFGNGNTSTLQNPVATYFTPSTYTVKLTVTNVNGSNTLTRSQYISVYESPTVSFTADKNNGCFPLRVQFTDVSAPGTGNSNVSWLWDFGDGSTSILQNPVATYTTAGIFNVTLRVTNDKGCFKILSFSNYISVTSGVKAIFTNTQPLVSSPPVTISFTNTSIGPGILNYQWNFGDGATSTLANPSHTYTSSGSFTATLVVNSNAGCTDSVQSGPIIIGGNTTSFSAPAIICVNKTATFTNTSSPVPVSSKWTFGDGTTANGFNATHSYAFSNIYPVKLYNTYSNYTDSVSKFIIVVPGLVPNFTSSTPAKCKPPLTVNFQDITPGAQSWLWIFGDGTTSTLQNPVHTYTSFGNFSDTLITSNSFGCTDTVIKTNYIHIQKSVISIPGFPKQGCIPFTISPIPVIVAAEPVISYLWDFGDGGTSSLSNPTHTYFAQGTYKVTLIITTASGCSDTLIIPSAVRAGSKPVTNFSAVITSVCANHKVQFTDLSAPADEWQWNFGDGSYSYIQNPIHNYNDTGYFSVTLITYNNGCPDSLVRTKYIHVLPPIARFKFTPDCSNRLQFTFTDTSVAPLTWQWNFGDGSPISFAQNPVHTFPAFAAYNINLIVTNGSCADTVTHIINSIHLNPDITVSADTICRGTPITFTASNINLSLTSNLSWNFGNGTQVDITSGSINYVYSNSGTYTVTLITTDINGCKDTIIKNNFIQVNGPTSAFTATNLTGCTGLTTVFNDLSTSDGVNAITNWQWNFGDGSIQNSGSPPMQHVYNIPNTFSIQLKVTDASGCSDSITIADLVTATDPFPDFISADTISCPGATVNFTDKSTAVNFNSLWDFGDGATSTITSPSHAYAATGFYNVKLRIQDIYGCPDSINKNLYIRVDKPIADFTMSDSVSSCTPLEVKFTNTSSFYSSVTWDFGTGQGNSTINNPVHYYTTQGIFLVKLIVTSPGGCTDTIVKNITVFNASLSGITYSPINGCKPLIVNLDAFSPGPIATYFWDFGDGYTQTTATPTITHPYASYGFFFPKLIMRDASGCIIPVQGTNIIPVTGAKAKFGVDKNLVCGNSAVTFIDSTTFNDPVTDYTWSFGDGGISTQSNPLHQYAAPGSYNVQLAIQTQSGCRDTVTKLNAIKVIQPPLINIEGDSVVCAYSSLLHSGIFLQPDTSIVKWKWSFPNGNTSLLQYPSSQTYNSAGNFAVTAVATNSSGCKDSITQNILVNPLPTVTLPGIITVQGGASVSIPATYTSNVNNWLWSPAKGLSCTDCPTPDVVPKLNITYQVLFTDTNGCSNTGSLQIVVLCKNANLFIPNTFSPNGDGSNDIFYPRGIGLDRVKLLRIFNRWGEIVFEKINFPVNDLSSGWDGTYKGKKPQAGVYIYQAEVFCENGEIIKLNGNIALIL